MTDTKRIDVAELARRIAAELLEHARNLEKQQKQLAGDNRRPMH